MPALRPTNRFERRGGSSRARGPTDSGCQAYPGRASEAGGGEAADRGAKSRNGRRPGGKSNRPPAGASAQRQAGGQEVSGGQGAVGRFRGGTCGRQAAALRFLRDENPDRRDRVSGLWDEGGSQTPRPHQTELVPPHWAGLDRGADRRGRRALGAIVFVQSAGDREGWQAGQEWRGSAQPFAPAPARARRCSWKR